MAEAVTGFRCREGTHRLCSGFACECSCHSDPQLDGEQPPPAPRHRTQVLGVRVSPHQLRYVRERSTLAGCSAGGYMLALLERDMEDELPPDVRSWLEMQAAQCDAPGNTSVAITQLVRHLARRWPAGCRLRED